MRTVAGPIALAVLTTAALGLAGCSSSGTSSPTTSVTTPSSTTTPAPNGTSTSSSAPSSSSSSSSSSFRPTPSKTSVPHASVLPNPTGYSSQTPVTGSTHGCVPQTLSVSSVGIDEETVVPMGTNAQGQIYPPARTTMWYDKSPQPGADGISVIAGHVEYNGPDEFYNLDEVSTGAPVTITCTNGKTIALRVSHKESILKTKLTTDQRVWGGSNTPVVALITCDRNSRVVDQHHLNNYVVWAVPA